MATKYGKKEDLLSLGRQYIESLKRRAAIEVNQKVGCPSVLESLGTKTRIKQRPNGAIEIECEGVEGSQICPQCPIFKERA